MPALSARARNACDAGRHLDRDSVSKYASFAWREAERAQSGARMRLSAWTRLAIARSPSGPW